VLSRWPLLGILLGTMPDSRRVLLGGAASELRATGAFALQMHSTRVP
jgi:hypothetical protein